MSDLQSTQLVKLRHALRQLLTRGEYEPAGEILEHFADLADHVEYERWQLRFALAGAPA